MIKLHVLLVLAQEVGAQCHAQVLQIKIVFDHAPVLAAVQLILHRKAKRRIISFILKSQDKLQRHFAFLNLYGLLVDALRSLRCKRVLVLELLLPDLPFLIHILTIFIQLVVSVWLVHNVRFIDMR